MIKTYMAQAEVEALGIWQAATGDGYWEDRATQDIQRVYLLGQLKATQSLHVSGGNHHSTKLRIKWLKDRLKELEQQS